MLACATLALLTSPAATLAQTTNSIWTLTTTPGSEDPEVNSLELGVKFQSDVSGSITGLRFYKYAQNTGTHVGNLWSASGALLGTVTFINETASGWQQATFASPIPIAAATTYVASYHTNVGRYASTESGFNAAVDSPPLHALASGTSGGNGVYVASASSVFPTQTWNASNYWVDVVFTAGTIDTTPPSVSSVTPASGATGVAPATAFTATFSESMNAATITTATVLLQDPSNATVAAAVSYTPGTFTATLTPNAPLALGTTYTATVKGGIGGVADAAGNTMTSDTVWSFTTGSCPCSIWTLATTPGPEDPEVNTLELGMKFQSDISGFITGLRFYKYAENTGTHVGNLWSASGTLLGTVTFASETASGWQQAAFTSPIPIAAGTTYVASYHTNSGRYAGNDFGFTNAVNSPPLHALSSGSSGGNGVYAVAASSIFPTQTWNAANYWVDVVLAMNVDSTPPVISSVTPATGSSGVASTTAVTATFSEALNAATITTATILLRDPSNANVPAVVSYNATTFTATLTPKAPLAGGTTYAATVKGAGGGVTDLAGNALASDVSWSFTTAVVSGGCPCSIWTLTTTPGPLVNDPAAVEVGVRFRSDVSGLITGLRFYKYAQNTGTHVGNLWTASGTLLGTVTFTSESSSGWQQATFASPIPIVANTPYIASYHTNVGSYADTDFGLLAGVDTVPLHALANGVSGSNGVYAYGATSAFPTQTWNASNYWVDVVLTSGGSAPSAPQVSSTTPVSGSTGIGTSISVAASFNEAVDPTTVTATNFQLHTASNTLVSATVSYNASTWTATLTPTSGLANASLYTANVSGVKDLAGNSMPSAVSWLFATTPAAISPTQGAGGPILIVTGSSNPFTTYYAEILRAEGLTEFATLALSSVTASTLANYQVVILGQQTLTASQVTTFTNWVQSGGQLIAFRPDSKLANLLGLTSQGALSLSNAYLLIDTTKAPGAGLVNQTIQFHGTADEYVPTGASTLATLYSGPLQATPYPAVTIHSSGSGQAAAFLYDLAASVVDTRQGNPAWAGQERDGFTPIRSDDLYYGAKAGDVQPDWVDLTRVAIPQADEQQRLLANLIGMMSNAARPLPRFWYFPRGSKAVVVMTGDDHAHGGTAGRFDQYLAASPAGCVVDNWTCIRSTSYIYPNTPITDAQVQAYVAQGFEVGMHLTMDPSESTCGNDFTPTTLASAYTSWLAQFHANFPSAPGPVTHRMHCIMWSDWSSQPTTELSNGIRLDTSYYYWPPNWVNDVPGVFTGSGMPMRYATITGSLIDVYQATSQMTDESGQTYPLHIDTLLDNALGPLGYYGAFTANMHTDYNPSDGSDAILASASARSVPIVSAKQMLTWLDARNGSVINSIGWAGNTLTFTVFPSTSANGLQVMVPANVGALQIAAITQSGMPINYTTQVIKGVGYAFITVTAGPYSVTYR